MIVARIALNAENFRALVAGEIVRETTAHAQVEVQIILSDIGLARMQEILDAEMDWRRVSSMDRAAQRKERD